MITTMKFIEIRDRATFIPALAFVLTAEDHYLAKRAGYSMKPTIVLMRLSDCEAAIDCCKWGNRTMHTAHHWIQANWSRIHDGDVVDVEFILGETATKKISERYTTAEVL